MKTLAVVAELLRAAIVAPLLMLSFSAAWSAPITMRLDVTVIQVCDDLGNNCASIGPAGNAYFEKETDKIWAQAGIDINFITGPLLKSTALLNGGTGIDSFTSALGGPGTTMWLVNGLACSGCTLFGEAWLNAGGLVINMGAVMAYNGGVGRLDTIAHEIGHNLNLDADAASTGYHSSNPNFLMAAGSNRNIPNGLANICPDGLCYDLLPQSQIETARRSNLLVEYTPTNQTPEPGSLALAALALLGAAGAAKRRRA